MEGARSTRQWRIFRCVQLGIHKVIGTIQHPHVIVLVHGQSLTPPIFHLFGKGLGQSGSNFYFGADCVCAPTPTHYASKPRPPKAPNASIHMLRSILVFMGLLPHWWAGLNPTARSLVPGKSVCQ